MIQQLLKNSWKKTILKMKIFIKTEKAFTSAQKADECLKKIKSSTVAPDGKWKPQKIETQNGEAICQCEVGVFELDLED